MKRQDKILLVGCSIGIAAVLFGAIFIAFEESSLSFKIILWLLYTAIGILFCKETL